jgi:hypothetical protein
MERFLRVARALRSLWEEGDRRADTRLFETLIRDEYVISGTSIKGETHPEHREHVVPRKVIRDCCLNLFDQGASDHDVAVFIRDHLKIIKITKEEAAYLNKGLKDKMPAGWTVGGDIMARFQQLTFLSACFELLMLAQVTQFPQDRLDLRLALC